MNFDWLQVVDEWRMKCEDLSNELESSQRECRNCSSELFRLRAAWDETVEQLDSVRRENKNLADEIKDLLDQLGEGGRSIHELDKQRRRLQVKFLTRLYIFVGYTVAMYRESPKLFCRYNVFTVQAVETSFYMTLE